MFKEKRGLSDVVTVTLIILLAITAVVIVWVFVRSTLVDVGEEIQSGSCVTVDVKPVGTCNIANGAVTISNGPGDTTIKAVKLIYYVTTAENSESATRDGDANCVDIGPLSQKRCSPADPDGTGPEQALPFANPARVGVAAIIGDNTVCPATSSTVTCS